MDRSISLENQVATGTMVTERHFGINFVADYERIGSKPWERFDETVSNLGSTSVRYPGGVGAETVFDYRNPNRSQILLEGGEQVNFAPLVHYLAYCNTNKINPTIIVPASVLLASDREDNHRTFDSSQTELLKNFVRYVLQETDPSLRISFEIGNEYEGYMTSTEYGRVANSVTSIIDQSHEDHYESLGRDCEDNMSDIFVQSWGYSTGGGLTPAEIAARNQQVIAQFSADNLARVDGLVSHYYFLDGRNSGTEYEQTLGAIAQQISGIADLHAAWELASGRQMISRTSEWNVSFRSETDIGLRQIRPIMEQFTNFLREGFDALDFWSAQYHSTSLAGPSGRLMVAGTLLDILRENVLDTRLGSTSTTEELGTYSFLSEEKLVAVLASSTEQNLNIDLAQSALPSGFIILGGYIIGVDEATSDGVYKELTNLPAYGDPDARVTVDNISMEVVVGTNSSVSLEPFECLVLIFSKEDPSRTTVYGNDSAEWIYASGSPSLFIGGGGWDTVLYIDSDRGINIELDGGSGSIQYAGDRFFSIESIIGSNYSDTIEGTSSGDQIEGWAGDDVLDGLRGNDSLRGGVGNDLIFGGVGNDEIRGGDGEDTIFGGGGNDSVFGGSGVDAIIFSDFSAGVTVWQADGVVETEWGRVKFSEIEHFIGSAHNDRFVLSGSNSAVTAGAGNDSIQVTGDGMQSLDLGDGDDSAQVWSAKVHFYGGSGKDKISAFSSSGTFIGGDGNDRANIVGNAWLLEGGEGDDVIRVSGHDNTFVFSGEPGHDYIEGFNLGQDEIIFKGSGCANARIVSEEGGTLIVFSDQSSVYFSNASILDFDGIHWLLN